jgi:hypothetical protein
MDAMTAYLYGSLNSDIYMQVLEGILVLNVHTNCNMYCVKLEAIEVNVVQPI